MWTYMRGIGDFRRRGGQLAWPRLTREHFLWELTRSATQLNRACRSRPGTTAHFSAVSRRGLNRQNSKLPDQFELIIIAFTLIRYVFDIMMSLCIGRTSNRSSQIRWRASEQFRVAGNVPNLQSRWSRRRFRGPKWCC